MNRRTFITTSTAAAIALGANAARTANANQPNSMDTSTMTIETLQQIWKTYQDAWADIAVDERERLLRQSVTDDVIFTAPPYEGQGLGNLVKHMEQFQEQVPGAYFKSNKLLTQHANSYRNGRCTTRTARSPSPLTAMLASMSRGV